ncbi:hypothetical protein DHBDCA_p74 [Dehalobacter sp. DCA]|nr:hypothetical protein DHBDCA_p74 [Dehalobacter sp. DCA]
MKNIKGMLVLSGILFIIYKMSKEAVCFIVSRKQAAFLR